MIYEVKYGDHPVRYSFVYPTTKRLFKRYLHVSDADTYDIQAEPWLIERTRKFLPEDSKDSYVEYRTLIGLTSKYLLEHKACIFHSVSFEYKGYAWLLSAPSGTGKTTQYLNWQRLFPDEIKMISGDMPVLEIQDDGSLMVYPTSWNGKEDIGNMISAPLGGIVILSQGNQNVASKLSAEAGVLPVFSQFIVKPDTEQQIKMIGKIAETMFLRYPVYSFTNKGDDDSTKILHELIDQLVSAIPEVNDDKI